MTHHIDHCFDTSGTSTEGKPRPVSAARKRGNAWCVTGCSGTMAKKCVRTYVLTSPPNQESKSDAMTQAWKATRIASTTATARATVPPTGSSSA